jgi:hypothetical protein
VSFVHFDANILDSFVLNIVPFFSEKRHLAIFVEAEGYADAPPASP